MESTIASPRDGLVADLIYLQERGLLRQSHLDGMRYRRRTEFAGFVKTEFARPAVGEHDFGHDPAFEVDDSDPATRGCLLELLREATKRPHLLAIHNPGRRTWSVVGVKVRLSEDDVGTPAPTEGLALVVALRAVAANARRGA